MTLAFSQQPRVHSISILYRILSSRSPSRVLSSYRVLLYRHGRQPELSPLHLIFSISIGYFMYLSEVSNKIPDTTSNLIQNF